MSQQDYQFTPQPNLPVEYSGGAFPAAAEEGAGISIQQLVSISVAYWKQSVAIGLLLFVAISALVLSKPKTYIATTTLMFNYQVNDPVAGKEFPLGLLSSYIATQMELIASSVVLMSVVDRLKLYDNENYVGKRASDLELRRIAAETVLEENISVTQGRFGSQLIFISYKGYSGPDAALIANTVAEVFTTRAFQGDSSPTEQVQAYSKQLAELKQEVDDAQTHLTEFYKRTGLISGDGANDADAAALGSLEVRLQEAQAARRTAEVAASTGIGGATSSTQNQLPQFRQQLTTQLAKMAELRLTEGPRHPNVVELQSQIDSTQKAIADEERTHRSSDNGDVEAARQLEGKLRGAIAEQRSRIVALTQLKEEREKYRLELESARTRYRRAVDSFEDIKRTTSSTYNNVSIVARAVPPTKASSRRTRVGLMIAMIGGGGIGLMLPLAYGFLNRRIRCRDDLERGFRIPVLVELGKLA